MPSRAQAAGPQQPPRVFTFTAQGHTVVKRLPPIADRPAVVENTRQCVDRWQQRVKPKTPSKRRVPHTPKGERGSAELRHLDGVKIARRTAPPKIDCVESATLMTPNRRGGNPRCNPPNRHARIAAFARHAGKVDHMLPKTQHRVMASTSAPVLEPMLPRSPIGLEPDEIPIVNTTKAVRPAMLGLVAAQLGWREDRSADLFDTQLPRAHLVWVVSQEELNNVLSSPLRRDNTRVSRIPGMHELCRKASFARLFRDCGNIAPSDAGPGRTNRGLHTWILPYERPPPSAFDRGPLIVKPDDGSQGAGISIITSSVELDLVAQKMARRGDGVAVVQEYVDRPLLLNGYKFDLRLYVLVLSLSPLRVFLCKEGLVRVCSEPYLEPTDSAAREERLRKNKLTRHLTNYGVSKHNDAHYDDSDDPNDGSRGTKRTLSSTMAYLQARGEMSRDVWNDVCRLVRNTTLELGRACRDERPEPELRLETLWNNSPPKSSSTWPCRAPAWNPHNVGDREKQDCFHLLGLDIIFDEEGTPHVLEANCGPSFNFDKIDVAGPRTGSPTPKASNPPPRGDPNPHFASETERFAGFSSELLTSRLRGFGTKVCRCSAMVKPHIHRPSKVDLVVKGKVLRGLCEIISRDIRARGKGVGCELDSKCGQCLDGSDAGIAGPGATSKENAGIWSIAAQSETSESTEHQPNDADDEVSTPRCHIEPEQSLSGTAPTLSDRASRAAKLVEGTAYSVIWAGDEDAASENVHLPDAQSESQKEEQPRQQRETQSGRGNGLSAGAVGEDDSRQTESTVDSESLLGRSVSGLPPLPTVPTPENHEACSEFVDGARPPSAEVHLTPR